VTFARTKRIALSALLMACWPGITGSIGFRNNFDERILAAHNRERATLGLPPLRWNAALSEGARQWSDHLARTGGFYHSPNEPGSRVGENIWGGTPGAYGPEAMVGLWIAEKRNYQPGTFPANSRTGWVGDVSHYTQVMWHSTDQVGCALSRGAGEEVLVCRYSGAGNIMGQKAF